MNSYLEAYDTVTARHRWASVEAKHTAWLQFVHGGETVRSVYAMLAGELSLPANVGQRAHQPVISTIRRRGARQRIEEMRDQMRLRGEG